MPYPTDHGRRGVLPRSRYRTPGPISLQPWDTMARHQRVLSAGVGTGQEKRGDLLASFRSWSSVGHSLPSLNLRRRLPRLDDVVMGPSPRCGRRHGVHLANEIQNWVRGVRVLLPPYNPLASLRPPSASLPIGSAAT